MKLNSVVPFGRSLDEYVHMFNLTSDDLRLKILGIADGPASFNAELTTRGGHVVSIDPIYNFNAKQIQQRFNLVVDDIIEQVKNTPDDWVWSYHKNPDNLRQNRINVIKAFTKDYAKSFDTQRYINASVPNLPFANHEFDLGVTLPK